MKLEIESILKAVPNVKVDQVGPLWRIRILGGKHVGARENGVSLAHDMLRKHRREIEEAIAQALPKIEPVEVPTFLAEPETPDPRLDLQAARIAELEAALAEMKRQATDMFDADALSDLVRENEPHSEAQRRWQSDYNQLNNRLVDPRLPPLSDAERALLNRLQKALYAGRKGAVGII